MRFLLFVILSIVIIPTCTFAEGKGIKIIAEDWPPFSFRENESITGFSIEIINQLMSDTGVKQDGKTEIWPWARALYEMQQSPNILIPAMHRNTEREHLFNWVGPLCPREIWIFKLASRDDITLQSLDDAKHYQIGSARKSSSTTYLLENGFTEDKQLQLTSIEIHNIKKLLAGHIDLTPFNIAEMAWHLKQLTPPVPMKTVTPALLMSGGSEYFIALSKQVPEPTVHKLQNALDHMKRDGRYQEIWRKYME